jgi:hypothetical protein
MILRMGYHLGFNRKIVLVHDPLASNQVVAGSSPAAPTKVLQEVVGTFLAAAKVSVVDFVIL